MTPHQAIAEYVPWLPGTTADKAARLGVHKSTLFHWLAEAEGRAPAPREGRAGRKRHREPTWADVLRLARLMREHGANVWAFAVTAERLAAVEMDAARVAALIEESAEEWAARVLPQNTNAPAGEGRGVTDSQ